MTKQEANKIIHAELDGGCWHELPCWYMDFSAEPPSLYPCIHCGYRTLDPFNLNPDYFTLEALGGMWARAIEKGLMEEFIKWRVKPIASWCGLTVHKLIMGTFFDPKRGPMALAEFIKEMKS